MFALTSLPSATVVKMAPDGGLAKIGSTRLSEQAITHKPALTCARISDSPKIKRNLIRDWTNPRGARAMLRELRKSNRRSCRKERSCGNAHVPRVDRVALAGLLTLR